MKPKRTQKNVAPEWQGESVPAGYRSTSGQAALTSRVTSGPQVKPFAGKVFYLDLPADRITDTLERDIKELGGTVETFFSKDIKYLVSNKMEAKYVQSFGQEPPVPSPYSGQSSPHPHSKSDRSGNNGDNLKSRAVGQAETVSRGKALVERVVKEQERVRMNKILSNALDWGVKILYIDDVIAYVKKKKKMVGTQSLSTATVKASVKAELVAKKGVQKCKGGRLRKQFIKVEDSSRHYCPIYLTISNMPQFNLKTLPPCSPFLVDDKDPTGNKLRGNRGVKASASEERAHGRKIRDKKRGGYCECCMIRYENVVTHLQSACHKAFSKSGEYFVVDKLVSTTHCNFLQIRTQVKRYKCSVSSVLIAPGPCGKPDQRHKQDIDSTEIIKEEQRWPGDNHKGFYSGHTSVPLILREEDTRSNDTCPERSNHNSLGCKLSCRQTSLTSCTQKTFPAKKEPASCRSKCVASIPSRDARVNPADQLITEDMSSSSSHFQKINIKDEVPTKSLSVETNRKDVKEDSSVQDGNKMFGNNLSEKNTGSLPSIIPVRKIQRRVRTYKRKRRKLETDVERVTLSDLPDDANQRLWELFESSDDMDLEFLGFEDGERQKIMELK
ncbi:protein DBF4 homolog A [Brachionichthys hirsutus]|uniref:protein DBF4 homolog A n=1 Tax=Brachionichthys hirsutus TaxID=412623 RepID=UPI003604F81D